MLFQFIVFVTILSNICIAVNVHECDTPLANVLSGFTMKYKVGKGDNDWKNACEENNECQVKKGAPIQFGVDFMSNCNSSTVSLNINIQLMVNEVQVERPYPIEDEDVMKYITLDNKNVQELKSDSIYRLQYDLWFGLLTPSSPINMTLYLVSGEGPLACGVIPGYFVD